MTKYTVPYSIIISGEFTVDASNEASANIKARRWISRSDARELHKKLLAAGMGSIRVHGDKITEVPAEPTESQWTGQRFKEKRDGNGKDKDNSVVQD